MADKVNKSYFNTGDLPTKEVREAREKLLHFRQASFYTEDDLENTDRINMVAAVVTIGGHHCIMFDNGPSPIFVSLAEAKIKLAPYKLITYNKKGDIKLLPGSQVWIDHPCRREYDVVHFAPGEPECEGEYNLFDGFGASSRRGDCSLFLEHLRNNICQRDPVLFEYVLDWLAQLVQFPGTKIGVALVLRGPMGVGKSVFAEQVGLMIGENYCPVIDHPELLTGRFNGHLERALCILCEEGFYAGDPRAAARMKHLITGNNVMIEHKGIKPYMAKSYCRVIITSNSERVIAAAPGERRYVVMNVGSERAKDGPYFVALKKQMDNGGRNGLMHLLMSRDISKVDFSKPPMTDALAEQIKTGFSAEDRWLETLLTEGAVQMRDGGSMDSIGWADDSREWEVPKDDLLLSFQQHVPGFRSPPTAQNMGTYLAKALPGVRQAKKGPDHARVRLVIFPPLAEAREQFMASHPGYTFSGGDIEALPLAA